MDNCVENTVETQKEWIAPELKKIEVEELTSYPFNFGDS